MIIWKRWEREAAFFFGKTQKKPRNIVGKEGWAMCGWLLQRNNFPVFEKIGVSRFSKKSEFPDFRKNRNFPRFFPRWEIGEIIKLMWTRSCCVVDERRIKKRVFVTGYTERTQKRTGLFIFSFIFLTNRIYGIRNRRLLTRSLGNFSVLFPFYFSSTIGFTVKETRRKLAVEFGCAKRNKRPDWEKRTKKRSRENGKLFPNDQAKNFPEQFSGKFPGCIHEFSGKFRSSNRANFRSFPDPFPKQFSEIFIQFPTTFPTFSYHFPNNFPAFPKELSDIFLTFPRQFPCISQRIFQTFSEFSQTIFRTNFPAEFFGVSNGKGADRYMCIMRVQYL